MRERIEYESISCGEYKPNRRLRQRVKQTRHRAAEDKKKPRLACRPAALCKELALLVLVPILSELLLPRMRRDLLELALSSAGHFGVSFAKS